MAYHIIAPYLKENLEIKARHFPMTFNEEEKLDYALANYSSIVLMKVYRNFDKIIEKIDRAGLAQHAILVSNSS